MASQSKLIVLNAGLIAGLALIVWQGRVRWDQAQAELRANVNVPLKKLPPPALLPAPKPEQIQAAKYADVAEKNLFSKDRNPTVVVDPPKTEAKPMPALPIVFGILGLPSGTKAIMADRADPAAKTVQAGDSIGEFKIVSLDSRKVVFDWNGKQVERNLDELVDRSGGTVASALAKGPAVPPPPAQAAPPTSKVLGAETASAEGPSRACTVGDTSPAGTVVDGYRKVGVESPFGLMGCHWVPVK